METKHASILLTEWLTNRGDMQKDFADRIKRADSTVSRWINRECLPSPQAMRDIEHETKKAVPISAWFLD